MTGGIALILGMTGRNLGAGMSGGRAFVLDLDRALVNQQGLLSGELELTPLSDADAQFVHGLMERHVNETGSAHARELLTEWESTRVRLTAITPRDFRRVTEIRVRAIDEGTDPDGQNVWEEILEVTGG